MLVSDAGEEHLFAVIPIIFLVFAYLDDAILDDVGQNHFCFCSTFRKLKLIGITGTNGKTTTVTLLHRMFRLMGYHVGLVSTIVM